jgi:hypothetical protein
MTEVMGWAIGLYAILTLWRSVQTGRPVPYLAIILVIVAILIVAAAQVYFYVPQKLIL